MPVYSWDSIRSTPAPVRIAPVVAKPPASPPKPVELPAWAKISKSSKSYRDAAKRLDFAAVGMIGYKHRVPRSFGDNEGVWPVKIIAGRDCGEILRKANAEQPLHECEIVEYVWCRSHAHATLLKATLDDMLLGTDPAARLRMAWRNCDQPAASWHILVQEAIALLGDFETMTEAERVERTQKAALHGA